MIRTRGCVSAVLCFVLVAFLLQQPASAESFKSAKFLSVPNGVAYVMTADVNGDGKLDLIYLTAFSSTPTAIEVALGNGDGTFKAPQALPAVSPSVGFLGQFSIADVNQDGKLDVIVAVDTVATNSVLGIYLGNGDGTFQSPLLSAGPTASFSDVLLNGHMGVGDFDGDGVVDLVVADVQNDTLSLLKGDNQGHFTLRNTWSDLNNPHDVHAVDLNGDGKLDIVAQCLLSATTSVYIGNGDGTFQARASYTGPHNTGTVVVQDMNNDGRPDLVVAGFNNTVDILLNRGDGTFPNTSAGGTSYAGVGPVVFAVQDFDKDGTLDIAVMSNDGIGILRGLGGLTYASVKDYPATNLSLSLFPTPPVAGDFDGDGHLDFAIPTPDGIALMFGRAGGTFESADAYDIKNQVGGLAEADFNGDKIPDLAVGQVGFTPRILLGKGDGTFTITADANQPTINLNAPITVTAGNFNGDNKVDLLTTEGNSFLSLGNGDGTFAAPTAFSPTALPGGFLVKDVNNDGLPDLVAPGGQGITVLLAQPNQTYTEVDSSLSVPLLGNVVFGDVNQDGKVDMIFNNNFVSTTAGQVAIALGNGDGSFTAGATYDVTESSSAAVALVDVDGDGHLDIVRSSGGGVANNNTEAGAGLQILFGHGDGTFDAPVAFSTPHSVALISGADLNMDGIGDLVLSDGYVVTVMNGAANRTFGAPRDYLAGGSPASPIIVDLNGDGGPDLVFANTDVNNISTATVLLNLGVTTGTLRANPNPAIYGQPVVLSASFAPTVAVAGVPTGTVSFAVDAAAAGSAPLQNGAASLSETVLAGVGTHTVKASWAGDDTFNAHTLSTTITITKADSSINFTVTPQVAVVGQKVSVAAHVVAQFAGVPSGTVTFQQAGGAASKVNVDATGTATLVVDTTNLATGNYSYTASYSGDANFNASSGGSAASFTVANFHLTATPAAVTVSGGGTGTVNVSVVSTTGFNGSVDLSCTGLPATARCAFAPAAVSLANAASGTSVMTVTASSSAGVPGIVWRWPRMPIGLVGSIVACCALAVAFVIAGFVFGGVWRANARTWARAAVGILLMVAGFAFAGCGGGGGGSGGTPTPVTYTVQIVATVHGSSPVVTRTVGVSVTVQP